MHAPLRNDLPIEMSELLQKPYVLKQHGTTAARSHGVLVFGYRRTGNGCELRLVSHGCSSLVFNSFQGLGKYLLVECHHRKQAQRRLMMKINAPYRASLSESLGKKPSQKARFLLLLPILLGGFHFTSDRTVNQLDVSHRCVVTSAEAALEDT